MRYTLKQEWQLFTKQRTIAGLTAQELILDELAKLNKKELTDWRIQRSLVNMKIIYNMALKDGMNDREAYYCRKLIREGVIAWLN